MLMEHVLQGGAAGDMSSVQSFPFQGSRVEGLVLDMGPNKFTDLFCLVGEKMSVLHRILSDSLPSIFA